MPFGLIFRCMAGQTRLRRTSDVEHGCWVWTASDGGDSGGGGGGDSGGGGGTKTPSQPGDPGGGCGTMESLGFCGELEPWNNLALSGVLGDGLLETLEDGLLSLSSVGVSTRRA